MVTDSTALQALGITVFEGLVPPDAIERINARIDAERHGWLTAHGGREADTAALFASMLRENGGFRIAEADACKQAESWTEAFFHKPAEDRVLHVIRCAGRDMQGQSYLKHFDSHALTLLIPLQLAETGERNGDLLVYRQQREMISPFAHFLVKTWLVIEHILPFEARRALVHLDLLAGRCVRVQCRPGNVYVFNGLVTMHANLDVTIGERRSLIIHHYDPGLAARTRIAAKTWRSVRSRIGIMR